MLETTDKRFAHEFIRQFVDGEVIFEAGDESREMFIVQTGTVAVSVRADGKEIELARLTRGDFVGEMALLESLPRTATARAVGDTRLLVLQPGGFLLKIRRDPTFAFEMLQRLSRRIRMTNEKLIDAIHQGNIAADRVQAIVSGMEFNRTPAAPVPPKAPMGPAPTAGDLP